MFGMPPTSRTGGYSTVWEVLLRHSKSDDGGLGLDSDERASNEASSGITNKMRAGVAGGYLQICDYKGWAEIWFNGGLEYAEDALKLINFLTGPDFLHPYDGVVAGRTA
jgi:hypothetical protein